MDFGGDEASKRMTAGEIGWIIMNDTLKSVFIMQRKKISRKGVQGSPGWD